MLYEATVIVATATCQCLLRSYPIGQGDKGIWEQTSGCLSWHGDDPAPVVDVIFNLVEGDVHYWFLLRNSALEFVPETVNPKDLEAVFAALKADPSVVVEMEARLWRLVKHCRLGSELVQTRSAEPD